MPTISADRLLLRTVTDSDFRNSFLDNPENFGFTADIEGLPMPVTKQDLSFVEWVNDASSLSALEVSACRSTCTRGPLTIICDGTTK